MVNHQRQCTRIFFFARLFFLLLFSRHFLAHLGLLVSCHNTYRRRHDPRFRLAAPGDVFSFFLTYLFLWFFLFLQWIYSFYAFFSFQAATVVFFFFFFLFSLIFFLGFLFLLWFIGTSCSFLFPFLIHWNLMIFLVFDSCFFGCLATHLATCLDKVFFLLDENYHLEGPLG